MTVSELIDRLSQFDGDCMVYVPSSHGRCDIVVNVGPLKHLDLPEGVAIPDDMVLLPWTDEEYEAMVEDGSL